MNDTSTPTDQLEAALIHDADAILVDVEFLAEHWADLGEQRRAGSPRPWRQALLDPERRAQMLARDQLERADRDPDAPGFTAAPLHVDVLDVIVDAWTVLDELATLISPDWRNTRTGHARDRAAAERLAPLPVDDISSILELIRTWLRPALPGLPARRVTAIGGRLHRAVTDVERTLALVRAGQMLTGALCPWCRGITPKHPEGGQTTMRVEELPASDEQKVPAVAAVVCWNSLCDPPTDKVSIRWKGRPAWSHGEWDWLAKQLIVAEPHRSQPRPPAPRPAGFSKVPVLPVERFGVSGVSRTSPATKHVAVGLDGARSTDRPDPPQPGQDVTFIGGPFARQVRRFTRIADELAVTAGDRGRPRLDSPNVEPAPNHRRVGVYRYELVSDRPTYVWTSEPQLILDP